MSPTVATAGGSAALSARLAARGIATADSKWTAAQREDLGSAAPSMTAQPANLTTLRDVVIEASVANAALVPVGGGSALAMGRSLERGDLALSLERLNRTVEHSPADFVVAVESGTRVADLQRTLLPHRQWLAFEPADFERATIGGCIASAAASHVAAGHGTLRNHLLGISVLYADGRVAKAGGRVVKNVAGYDLMKLHHGALGTLGVIATATLRLRPLPMTDLVAWTRVDDANAIVAAADALAQPGFLPASAHVCGNLRAGGFDGDLVVRFQGARAAALGQASSFEAELASRTSLWRREVIEAGDRSSRPAPLQLLDDLAGRGDDVGTAHVSLHFPPSRFAQVLALLQRFGAGRVALELVRGTGFLKLATEGGTSGLTGALADGLAKLRADFASFGAALFAQAGPPPIRAALEPFATNPGRERLARALRAELDPSGLFNRGRLGATRA